MSDSAEYQQQPILVEYSESLDEWHVPPPNPTTRDANADEIDSDEEVEWYAPVPPPGPSVSSPAVSWRFQRESSPPPSQSPIDTNSSFESSSRDDGVTRNLHIEFEDTRETFETTTGGGERGGNTMIGVGPAPIMIGVGPAPIIPLSLAKVNVGRHNSDS